MDDFKTSTRAMLEVVRGEKARLKKRMDELDERERIILKWIEDEEGPQQELLPSEQFAIRPRVRLKPSLKDLLREVMQDGRPRTNEELRSIASMRGIVDENVDLRTINSTMLALMNAGEPLVRRDDKWIRKVKPLEERA